MHSLILTLTLTLTQHQYSRSHPQHDVGNTVHSPWQVLLGPIRGCHRTCPARAVKFCLPRLCGCHLLLTFPYRSWKTVETRTMQCVLLLILPSQMPRMSVRQYLASFSACVPSQHLTALYMPLSFMCAVAFSLRFSIWFTLYLSLPPSLTQRTPSHTILPCMYIFNVTRSFPALQVNPGATLMDTEFELGWYKTCCRRQGGGGGACRGHCTSVTAARVDDDAPPARLSKEFLSHVPITVTLNKVHFW